MLPSWNFGSLNRARNARTSAANGTGVRSRATRSGVPSIVNTAFVDVPDSESSPAGISSASAQSRIPLHHAGHPSRGEIASSVFNEKTATTPTMLRSHSFAGERDPESWTRGYDGFGCPWSWRHLSAYSAGVR